MNHIIKKVSNKILFFSNRLGDVVLKKKYPLLNPHLRKKAMGEGALGVVLMLHRVAEYDKSRLVPNEDLKVSPAFLQKTINKYKEAGFAFLSLDEVYNVITKKNRIDRPFVSFTLDDGYLDNYTTAYPIFKKNNIPFCIFVATDFPDKRAILWWITIEDLILSNGKIQLADGSTYICQTYQQKWDTFRLIREKILKLDQKDLLASLQKLFANYQIDWLEPIQKMSMSWDNIRELGKEPLCTIGGHTMTHPSFIPLTLEEIKAEIDGGVARLKTVIEYDICHFAYPYGSIKEDGEREYEFLKSFNFKTAFVSFGGVITKNDINSMTHLPRFMLRK
ncbi:MAG: polysaccharide deacetylase family protein [Prevotella sp.]|jgi:peptidoglycan/xylan/chitin deacetylase (PgdA/CDA1 family)|nr:polysaccharide deacetylase family protein [Prevotella sp.]